MNMSYHASWFSIAYIIRVVSFDSLKVKCLNSHTSISYIDARTYAHEHESMYTNDDEREEEITLHQI